MPDKDFIDELEGLFSEVAPEPEVEGAGDGSLLKEIVVDLLEGEVLHKGEVLHEGEVLLEDEAVTEPGAAEPATEVFQSIQTELKAKDRQEEFILEEAVAGLFEEEVVIPADAVQPVFVEVPPSVSAESKEAKEERDIPPSAVSSLKATLKEQRFRLLNIGLQVSPVLLGLLLLSLMIGLFWLTPAAWLGLRILCLTGCAVAIAITVIQWRFNRSLASAFQAAREKHVAAVLSQTQLEERVRELTTANTLLQKRDFQFQRANQVIRTLNLALGLDQLVQEAVNLVRDQFDLYYAGLFLLDDSGQWAVLRAGSLAREAVPTSYPGSASLPRVPGQQVGISSGAGRPGEFGRHMPAQGYQLEVGGNSTVGRCTATIQPLVITDLDEEPVHFDNPPLPQTRSRMTLPLQSAGRVIGALDLQSAQPHAFSPEDVGIFQAIADQLAVAIDNAQAFARPETRLEAAEELRRSRPHEQRTGVALEPFASLYERSQSGVTSRGAKALSEVEQAMSQREVIIQADTRYGAERAALVAPITLRGEVIGALGFEEEHMRQWTADEIALVEDVTTQVALAVENVRLFEQTQTALEETEALYLASSELNTAQSYEGVLDALRRHTMLGGSQNVTISLFDRAWVDNQTPDWIEVVARWSEFPPEDLRSRYPMATFSAWAAPFLRPDAPTLIEDVADDPRVGAEARAVLLERFGAHSSVFVPLVVGGQWIGNINALYQEPTAFPQVEVRRLTALSGQAAVAVQGLRQLGEIQARARREALIREITSKVRASTDLDTILRTTVTEVSKALGTYQGAIRLGAEESLEGGAGQEPSHSSTKSRRSPGIAPDNMRKR